MSTVMDLTPMNRQESEQARASSPARPLTVIEHAINSGASAEQLERLLELQVRADNHQLELMREKRRMDEEDRKAQAILAFRNDFAGFRGENVIIPKSRYVDRGKAGSFFQAEYDGVCGLLSPALSKHGFSFRHDQQFGARPMPTAERPDAFIGWVTVTCFLEHRLGHVETLTLEGPEGDATANTPVQNMQVTASYLKRQSLLALTGTATAGEDNETKMRKQEAHAAASDEVADKLRDAGEAEAGKGMAALTAWWGALTARQRTSLNADFAGWRKAAQRVDAGAAK